MRKWYLVASSLALASFASAAAPSRCDVSTLPCANGPATCSALTYGPTPVTGVPTHDVFRWASGACAKQEAAVVCTQKLFQGKLFGEKPAVREETTYACCDRNGNAFVTKDAVQALEKCDHI